MTENPFVHIRGKLNPDNPKTILANDDGPITPEVMARYNRAKWGKNGSGPIEPSKAETDQSAHSA